MATTAEDCRRILAAQARTGRRVDVAFNYRFAPTSRKIRELLASGRIGEVSSVDFHWYLDTAHGADYFRRWHAYKRHSGSLFVHKATHHFDLLNWWIDSDPVRVFAQGALRRYGAAGPFRGVRCKTCEHAAECDFHLDIAKSPWLDMLYEAPSAVDGYFRDACVFREDIDIYDTMTAAIRYANGVQVSYSLNAFMPIEGYHLAFNGTRGRIEVRMYEKQAFEAKEDEDEILVLGTDRLGRAHHRPPRPRRPLRRRPAPAQEPLRPRLHRPRSASAPARAPAPCPSSPASPPPAAPRPASPSTSFPSSTETDCRRT